MHNGLKSPVPKSAEQLDLPCATASSDRRIEANLLRKHSHTANYRPVLSLCISILRPTVFDK